MGIDENISADENTCQAVKITVRDKLALSQLSHHLFYYLSTLSLSSSSSPPRPADLWHNFPLTMKKMNSVTWMMSGQDYLENGEVVTTFTKHNLKELQVRTERERREGIVDMDRE